MKTTSFFSIFLLCLAVRIDAQESWVAQNDGLTGAIFGGVDFVDSNTGWVAGNLKSTNGGTTWINQTNNGQWMGEDFIDANNGWTVGGGGVVSHTTNGGATWATNSTVAGSSTSLKSVHFVNASNGWAVGYALTNPTPTGYIIKTTNGGSTWTLFSSASNQEFYAVDFVDANTGWTVGNTLGSCLILKIFSGGSADQSIVTGTSSCTLNAVDFVDANTGWAVGIVSDTGLILKTSNGGTTWTRQREQKGMYFNSVSFVDVNTGWAVGTGGTILATSNGGTTWIVQSSGTTNVLKSVSFVDAAHGWAVGDGGTLLKHMGRPTPILISKPLTGRFGIEPNGQNLRYELFDESHVSVLLFEGRGRLALKLLDATQQAGSHNLAIPISNSMPRPLFLDFQENGIHEAIKLP